jgi:hypothetical protein
MTVERMILTSCPPVLTCCPRRAKGLHIIAAECLDCPRSGAKNPGPFSIDERADFELQTGTFSRLIHVGGTSSLMQTEGEKARVKIQAGRADLEMSKAEQVLAGSSVTWIKWEI